MGDFRGRGERETRFSINKPNKVLSEIIKGSLNYFWKLIIIARPFIYDCEGRERIYETKGPAAFFNTETV